MKRFKVLVLFFLILAAQTYSQSINQIEVITATQNKFITVHEREGTIYFSVLQFAEAISANYFVNEETQKIELKFPEKTLKITAKNPFYVLTDSNNYLQVYQLPVSTYFIDDEIFIPLFYSMKILEKALGRELIFKGPNRLMVGRGISTDITKTDETLKEKNEEEISEKISENKIEENKSSKNYDISDLIIDEKANGTLVRLKSNKRITTYNSSFKAGVLTIILKDASSDAQSLSKIKDEGLIKEITVKNNNGDTEIKFKVGKEYSTSEVINASGSSDILITLHNKVFSNNEEKEKNKSKWNFDVIVIDAGHGGHDAGAIGINGVKEKDVNLAIALKLGKLLEENLKDVKVVYTRKNDSFVELYKRGKIANDKNGKLFISIHCNSTPQKPTDATGFEVYLLRPGRTKEAIAIAERENSVIQFEDNQERYQKLTDENFILVSMAHSSYMKYSEKFSDLLDKQFSGDLSLASRGIKQAGFYVLVGASMPSVLIETGFLSNKNDANYLKSSKDQQQIAKSIFESIKKFKEHYELVIDSDS